ncbi:Prolycopene isomerase, chloroplastic [Porphyridium purpureum]|uniref:prolycopene isomerase n=1 Tax=Porphyridium purpureum TaxID=35688 RepID=A0A5J4Z3X5_PORPP|nr:Prolycopene isomerase, chloroplastic [Porphyridium purpureum]|eukprot:POR1011..scf295_1
MFIPCIWSTQTPAFCTPTCPRQQAKAHKLHLNRVCMQATAKSQSGKEQQADADVIVIGSGIGGLVTATQLARKGARVLVLEQYIIPGGSAGAFSRDGYVFDVGASMIFGFGTEGSTNLLTRALADVNRSIETFPDPVQINYHLPNALQLRVHKDYEKYVQELSARFPHEEKGIRRFYKECWNVFNSLNAMELLSLEEPRYLWNVFLENPIGCLQLLRYFPQNVGDVARKHIEDKELLHYIDIDCYLWSVVKGDRTPMINAGMVFCDRHYGGINYPKGGVGKIAEELAASLADFGSQIQYKKRVREIVLDNGKAAGVLLADGTELRAPVIVSNATRWNTFGSLIKPEQVPASEQKWRERYEKSPSFLSLHLGVDASVIPSSARHQQEQRQGHAPQEHVEDCHHIVLEDWAHMEDASDATGTLFLSIPTLLDPTLAPPGKHIFHMFTPSNIEDWEGLSPSEYEAKKTRLADRLIARLERAHFPGLASKVELKIVGTPRTHRRFLGRSDGSYGPVPAHKLWGLVSMPFNRTDIEGLYCVGDSAFPGQGLNAVAFSGYACAHRVACDLGLVGKMPVIGDALANLLSKTRLKIER